MPVNMQSQGVYLTSLEWSALPAPSSPSYGLLQLSTASGARDTASPQYQACSALTVAQQHVALAAAPTLSARKVRNLQVQIPRAYTDDSQCDGSMRPSHQLPTMGLFEVQQRIAPPCCPPALATGCLKPAFHHKHHHPKLRCPAAAPAPATAAAALADSRSRQPTWSNASQATTDTWAATAQAQ